jgi:hypothetical protein
MLRSDAQSTVSAWAGGLMESVDDLPAIVAGATPSVRTKHLLEDTTKVGDIYRYKIADRTGHTVFSSERAVYPSLPNAATKRGFVATCSAKENVITVSKPQLERKLANPRSGGGRDNPKAGVRDR